MNYSEFDKFFSEFYYDSSEFDSELIEIFSNFIINLVN